MRQRLMVLVAAIAVFCAFGASLASAQDVEAIIRKIKAAAKREIQYELGSHEKFSLRKGEGVHLICSSNPVGLTDVYFSRISIPQAGDCVMVLWERNDGNLGVGTVDLAGQTAMLKQVFDSHYLVAAQWKKNGARIEGELFVENDPKKARDLYVDAKSRRNVNIQFSNPKALTGKLDTTAPAKSDPPEPAVAASPPAALVVGEIAQITEPIPGSDHVSPSISPDGKYVAVNAATKHGSYVGLYSFADKKFKILSKNRPDGAGTMTRVAFSPDGKKILVSFSGLGIWTVDEADKYERIIADPFALSGVWSPDGKSILYWVVNPRNRKIGSSVVLYDLETGKTRTVAKGTAQYTYREPSFAPDGARVVYARWGKAKDGRSRVLVIQDLGGKEQPRVIPLTHEFVGGPAFSPDGRYIAYRGGKPTYTDIYVYDLAGDSDHRMTTTYGLDPVWWPDAQSIVFAGPLGPLTENVSFGLFRMDLGAIDETE